MDYAEKLWDLSNAITAFAVVQALAFAYCFKDDGFPGKVRKMAKPILIGIIAATLVYVAAIAALNCLQLQMIDSDPTDLKLSATNMAFGFRIGAVLIANGFILFLTRIAK